MENADSITLVLARVFRSYVGTCSRCTVSMLSASLAPAWSSTAQAALSFFAASGFCSSVRRFNTLRRLWTWQRRIARGQCLGTVRNVEPRFREIESATY